MVPWEDINIDGSEPESNEDSSNSSTEFGDDDIYMSDEMNEQSEDEALSREEDVMEEPLVVPDEYGLSMETDEVEQEMEGDFTRNYQSRLEKQGKGKDAWSFDFQEEFRDDMRQLSGVGIARVRGRKRGQGPKLSQEAQSIFGEANLAFVSGQTQDALQLFQEVIRMEPRHKASWSAIASCFESMGQSDKALQIEVMGAHLQPTSENWYVLGAKSKNTSLVHQALYCYRKACKLNPDSIEANWEYGIVCKEMGNNQEAISSFKRVLEKQPNNLVMIDEILPLTSQERDFETAIKVLQAAFDYYQREYPDGPPSAEADEENLDNQERLSSTSLQDYHIVALADCLIATQRYGQAIKVIRNGARWIQLRRNEAYLESLPDDREYDADGIDRADDGGISYEDEVPAEKHHLDVNFRHRLARARIMNGDTKEGILHINIVLKEDVEYFAELFVELADALADKSMFKHALPIYERILSHPTVLSIDTVLKIGNCFQASGRLQEAEEMYLRVLSDDREHREAKLKLAEVYESQNQPQKALALVYEVIDARKNKPPGGTNITENDTQVAGETPLISAPKLSKRRRTRLGDGLDSEPRMTRLELQQREKDRTAAATQSLEKLRELADVSSLTDEGLINTWVAIAGELIDDFRSAKELFPADKHAIRAKASKFKGLAAEEVMVVRLEAELDADLDKGKSKKRLTIPTTYRNALFPEWLKIIVEYSLFIASRGEEQEAREVLSHSATSYLFSATHDPQSRLSLLLAQIAVAIRMSDLNEVISLARTLVKENQFNNEALRIFLASITPGLRGTDAFIDRNVSKWSLRMNRQWDMGVSMAQKEDQEKGATDSDDNIEMSLFPGNTQTKLEVPLRWNGRVGRWIPIKSDERNVEDEGDEEYAELTGDSVREPLRLPTRRTAIGRYMQASMLNASKFNHAALYYMFEAHEIVPEDPLLCLGVAVSTLARAQGRRADNRQQLIVQTAAFMEEYRKFRGADNLATQEVEYNFGRFFHQLNLGSFAVRHYRRVLVLAEEWQQTHSDDPGFGPEAAYNLSLLYVLSGAPSLAKDLYRRWLSI
ncbi:transcription factor TFIIIC subunit tfc4 [Serendipita sp. 401]|nr:transcription factor TFIIIC subunit tfc4 [Serendipita sp. 401]